MQMFRGKLLKYVLVTCLVILVLTYVRDIYRAPDSLKVKRPPIQYYGHPRLRQYEDYFKPATVKRNAIDYNFITTSNICQRSGTPILLIMVLSTAEMTSQRAAIRSTWGSTSSNGHWPGVMTKLDVKVVFLFGRSDRTDFEIRLKEECEKYGDIVQANFVDSYYNLTHKVLMGFEWVEKFCSKSGFVMKVDEDTFVNVPRFQSILSSLKVKDNVIIGPYCRAGSVLRDGKYKVTTDEYPPPIFPPHVKDNVYVMSTPTAIRIRRMSAYFSYVPMKDAYITGIVAKALHVRHVNVPGYELYRAATYCELVTEAKVASQRYTAEMFSEVWQMMNGDNKCRNTSTFKEQRSH